ncbi:MAG: DMT family transporter [Alphaproteobacteria bacterium]
MLDGLSNTKKGVFYALAGYGSFAFSDAGVKWLGDTYETGIIVFWVYVVVLISCIIFAFPRGLRHTFKTKTPLVQLARGICMFLISYCAVAALSKGLPLSTFYTVIFMCPIVTALAAIPIYKEPISARRWIIILLGFTGVVVAFHKDVSFSSYHVIYAFGVLVFATILNLLARQINPKESILTLAFYPAIIVLPFIFSYSFGDIPIPQANDIPLFLATGFLCFIGITGVSQCFRIAPHAAVAPAQYTEMIYGIVIGYYLFGDSPSRWILIGASMIAVSGILLVSQKR